jgi:hypothetical protein
MVWVAWFMKMTAEPMRVIGATVGGMAMDEQPLRTATRTRENIDSTNAMDVASTVGRMDGSTMESSARISDMGREPFGGQTERLIKETFIKDSEKGMDATRFQMEDTTLEVGWMDGMKALEVSWLL